MHFFLTKDNLTKALFATSRLASGKMPLPILNNILIACNSGSVTFSVTNLEVGIRTTVPAKVEKEGMFTVSARLLAEFAQNCPDTTLEALVLDNATLHITGERTSIKMRGLDASEFPTPPFSDNTNVFTLKSTKLKEGLDQVVFACALDETRPVLGGVLVSTSKDTIVFAATDSYRLAEKKVALTTTGDRSVIIPRASCSELSRLLSEEAGDISVFVGDNQVQFSFGSIEFVSRLIEGNYPNYRAIIPDKYQTRVTAHLGDLVSGLKLTGLVAREAGNIVKLSVSPGKGMVVHSEASQRGEVINQLTAIAEGEEVTIAFNVKYLLEALSVIHSDNVFLEMDGPERPIVIRPANSKEYFSLVMPLKVD